MSNTDGFGIVGQTGCHPKESVFDELGVILKNLFFLQIGPLIINKTICCNF